MIANAPMSSLSVTHAVHSAPSCGLQRPVSRDAHKKIQTVDFLIFFQSEHFPKLFSKSSEADPFMQDLNGSSTPGLYNPTMSIALSLY